MQESFSANRLRNSIVMHFFLVAHHLHLLTQTAVSALMLQYSICSVEHLAISNQLPFLNREEMKRLGHADARGLLRHHRFDDKIKVLIVVTPKLFLLLFLFSFDPCSCVSCQGSELFGGLATTVAHNPSFFPFLVSLLFAISSNKYYSKSLAISSKKTHLKYI